MPTWYLVEIKHHVKLNIDNFIKEACTKKLPSQHLSNRLASKSYQAKVLATGLHQKATKPTS